MEVEGLLIEKVASMKASLDCLAAPEGIVPMRRGENVVATYSVFRSELGELVHCLSSYSDASLTKRHRTVRKMAAAFLTWLEHNDVVFEHNSGGRTDVETELQVDFVRKAVAFLSGFHITMRQRKKKAKIRKSIGYSAESGG